MRSFIELTEQPEAFFQLLPADWAGEITPVWAQYSASGSRIFGVKAGDEVVAGGIVFTTVSPDTQAYANKAQAWFDKGCAYFGFLFVSPGHRGKGLGTYWIEQLRNAMPAQPFWLAIEDEALVKFYDLQGFAVKESVDNEGTKEWILADI